MMSIQFEQASNIWTNSYFSDLIIAQLQKQQTEGGETDVQCVEENIKKVKDIALTTKKSVQNSVAAADE